MEALRRSPAYAEGQIRLLLSDLKSSNHAVRVKAVKHFQDYIVNYGPEIYDDDVDFLFTGTNEAVKTGMGLLYFSGLDSDKHDGQLKRIAAPTIALIAWLISLEVDNEEESNVFYERFVQLPSAELAKINFAKHISIDGGGGRSKAALRAQQARVLAGQTRSGSSADALRLLSVLMRDHRTVDGEPDPIDLNALLHDDAASKQIVDHWLSKSANEDVAKALEHFRGLKAQALAREVRPTTWAGVTFRPVPLQVTAPISALSRPLSRPLSKPQRALAGNRAAAAFCRVRRTLHPCSHRPILFNPLCDPPQPPPQPPPPQPICRRARTGRRTTARPRRTSCRPTRTPWASSRTSTCAPHRYVGTWVGVITF